MLSSSTAAASSVAVPLGENIPNAMATTNDGSTGSKQVTAAAKKEAKWTFAPVAPSTSFLQDKSVLEYLEKWGLSANTRVQQFQFHSVAQQWSSYQFQEFLDCFFQDPALLTSMQVMSAQGGWVALGCGAGSSSTTGSSSTGNTTTTALPLSTQALTLDFLEQPLRSAGIVRSTAEGDIVKCMDEYTEDHVIVSDELRKCLLMPECETWDTFGVEQRQEFLFHILRTLALGGALCQFEDQLQPYLEVTKKMYKSIVSVAKDVHTQQIKITSYVYQIVQVNGTLNPLFPQEHPQNHCYLVVDPRKRMVTVWYHAEPSYY